MTASLPYSTAYDPPCPVLTLRVAAPRRADGVALVGLVDTGADMTLIPETLGRSLGLPVVSRLGITGVTGIAERADVVAATIELAGRRVLAEVVAFGDETIVGRDLLNRLMLRLDGPGRRLEVDASKTDRRRAPISRAGRPRRPR